jgi:hypothetical protein
LLHWEDIVEQGTWRWAGTVAAILLVAFAVVLLGCAGAVVGTMTPGERRSTCELGGRQYDGRVYPARIRVPAEPVNESETPGGGVY